MNKAIDHDRVMMAIASNQGGCSVFEVMAEDIKPGMSIDLDGQWAKVQEVETTIRNTHLLTDTGRHTISGLFDARYKSIEEAIEEMKFAMGLTGIYDGYFCPGKGEAMIKCGFVDAQFRHMTESIESANSAFLLGTTGFRKPQPGMLLYAKALLVTRPTELLMVSDRPEDQAAAEAAGFAFEWASDFFGGSDNAGK